MAEAHNSSSEENLTNDEIKNRVINIFNDFVSDVDPDQLSDFLIAKRVITIDRWNEIRTEKTTQRKCRELLLYLLSITHPTAFLVVREALEKICHHIWEKIQNQPSRTSEEGLKFNTRLREEKEKLVKEMNEERLLWNMEKEVLENRNKELNQELLKWKTEKENLEKSRPNQATKQPDSKRVSQVAEGQPPPKTTYQRSAIGPVSISEVEVKYVTLQNTGKKDEQLCNWSLTQNVDGKDVPTYNFRDGYVLKAGENVKIWEKGAKPAGAPSEDIEADVCWETSGATTVITKLFIPSGEERATHIRRTQLTV